jgi:hypothetical protein
LLIGFLLSKKGAVIARSPSDTLRVHPEGFSLKDKLRDEAIPCYGQTVLACHQTIKKAKAGIATRHFENNKR